MNKASKFYKDVGEVEFIRKRGNRNIRIVIKPFSKVTVSFPWHTSISSAEIFFQEKMEWVIKTRQKMQKVEDSRYVFGKGEPFRTRFRDLNILPLNTDKLYANINLFSIDVFYPEGTDIENDSLQYFIKKTVEIVLKDEAEMYLPERVKYLSEKFSFRYNNLTIKKSKRLWGCCYINNNIFLNYYLMRLPEHLSDFVILHELVHTIYKNHGPAYKQKLDSITGGYKKLEKELKTYSISI